MTEWSEALLTGLKGQGLDISRDTNGDPENTETATYNISLEGVDIYLFVERSNIQYGKFYIYQNKVTPDYSSPFYYKLNDFLLIFHEIDGYVRRHTGRKETAVGLRAQKRLGDFFRYGLYPFMEIGGYVGHGNPDKEYKYSFADVLLYDVKLGLTVIDRGMLSGEDTLELMVMDSGKSAGPKISFTLTDSLDFKPLVQYIRQFSREKTKFEKWQCDVLDAFMDTGKIRYQTQTHFERTSEVFSILLQGYGQTAFFQMHFIATRNDTNYYTIMDMFGTKESTIHKAFNYELPKMEQLVGDVDLFLSKTQILKLPSDPERRKSLLLAIDKILTLMQNTDDKSPDYSTLRDLLRDIMAHLRTP
jgi:hypothetical protein